MRSPDLVAIVTLAINGGGHGVTTDGDTSTHQSGKIINQYPPSPHTRSLNLMLNLGTIQKTFLRWTVTSHPWLMSTLAHVNQGVVGATSFCQRQLKPDI